MICNILKASKGEIMLQPTIIDCGRGKGGQHSRASLFKDGAHYSEPVGDDDLRKCSEGNDHCCFHKIAEPPQGIKTEGTETLQESALRSASAHACNCVKCVRCISRFLERTETVGPSTVTRRRLLPADVERITTDMEKLDGFRNFEDNALSFHSALDSVFQFLSQQTQTEYSLNSLQLS